MKQTQKRQYFASKFPPQKGGIQKGFDFYQNMRMPRYGGGLHLWAIF